MADLLSQIKKNFNLNLNEAKIYLSLITNGPLSVSEIAEQTNISKSRIYETLKKLEIKKFVIKNSNDKKLWPAPPKESISSMLAKERNLLIEKEEKLQQLSDYLTEFWRKSLSEEISPGAKILPFKEIEYYLEKTLSQAQRYIDIAVSTSTTKVDWSKIGSSLRKLRDRRVQIRYLVNDDNVRAHLELRLKRYFQDVGLEVEIKSNPQLRSSFILIDDILFLLFTGNYTSLETLVLQTLESDLSSTFKWLYDSLWEN